MTTASQRLGHWGEQMALKYLYDYGYGVIAQNWRFGRMGELDIVTTDANGILIGIEVKTGYTGKPITPLDQLTPAKIAKLYRLMEAFIVQHPQWSTVTQYRIDGIIVERQGNRALIRHIKNLVR